MQALHQGDYLAYMDEQWDVTNEDGCDCNTFTVLTFRIVLISPLDATCLQSHWSSQTRDSQRKAGQGKASATPSLSYGFRVH